MFTTFVLIASLASARAEPVVPRPQYTTGDVMVYSGEVIEESTRIDIPYKRKFDLEVHVFVMGTRSQSADLAVMTLLRPQDDAAVIEAVATVTGQSRSRNKTPPAVRLELIRVDPLGKPRRLVPRTNPPFTLDEKTETQAIPALPLDRPAGMELGFLAPRSNKPLVLGGTWNIAEADRPDSLYSVNQSAVLNGTQVVEIVGVQKTAHWANPSGLESNWHRVDSVWVATADGLARQFARTIEIKDGVHVVEKRGLSCTMTSPPSPNRGDGYTSLRREIEHAIAFAAELDGGQAIRLQERIDAYERRYRETSFRVAIEAVKRRLR